MMVEHALALAQHGFKVIPLHGSGAYLNGWQTLATTDPDQIRAWWQDAPHDNVGWVVDEERFCLDIDPRHGGREGLASLEKTHGDLPATWTVLTGGEDRGKHLIYRVRPGWKHPLPYVTDIQPGVQVLGLTHNVVGVGSRHHLTGHPYVWDTDGNPVTMPEPALVPAWVTGLVHATHRGNAGTPAVATQNRTRPVRGNIVSEHPGSWDTMFPLLELSQAYPWDTALVAALLRDQASQPALLVAVGYAAHLRDGAKVRCPCHEHAHGDASPSGMLREPNGKMADVGVWCWISQQFRSLTSIYHLQQGGTMSLKQQRDTEGKVLAERRVAYLVWGIRLLRAAGLLTVPVVHTPPLPPVVPRDVRTLWETILDIVAHRAVVQLVTTPCPLTGTFLRDWAAPLRSWGSKRLKSAFGWLVGRGWLTAAATAKRGMYVTALWRVLVQECPVFA